MFEFGAYAQISPTVRLAIGYNTGSSGAYRFVFDVVSESSINASGVIVDFERSLDVIDLGSVASAYFQPTITETDGDTDIAINGTDFLVKLDGTGHNLGQDQFVF